jgi:hypothetical protein
MVHHGPMRYALGLYSIPAVVAACAVACAPAPLSSSPGTSRVVAPPPRPSSAPVPAEGGSLPVVAPPTASACTPQPYHLTVVAPCGNGRIDSTPPICAPCPPGKPCPCAESKELCDGGDVGGKTCQEMGFSAGQLSCNDSCTALRNDDCSACLPGRRCATVSLGERVTSVSSAARGADIGVAWVEVVDSCERTRFARVGADGQVRSVSPPMAAAQRVAVVATARGWLLATEGGGGVSTWVIEPNGDVVGPVSHVKYGALATLVAGAPGGSSLLELITYGAGFNVHAALVSDGGEVLGSPVMVFEGAQPGPIGEAASTGDGFLIPWGRPLEKGPQDAGASFRRIEKDGSLGPLHPITGVHVDQFFSVSWSGAGGALMAQAKPGEYDLVPIDREGQPTGAPKHLAMPQQLAGAVDIAGRAMLSQGDGSSDQTFSFVRWDSPAPRAVPLAKDRASMGFALHTVSGRKVAVWLSARTTSAKLTITEVP